MHLQGNRECEDCMTASVAMFISLIRSRGEIKTAADKIPNADLDDSKFCDDILMRASTIVRFA